MLPNVIGRFLRICILRAAPARRLGAPAGFAAVVGVTATLMGACSVDFTSTQSASMVTPPLKDSDAGGAIDDSALPFADAGAPDAANLAPAFRGSPLCNASETRGCFPDDPKTCGASDAGTDGGPLTCRVHHDSTTNAPLAACATAGNGGNGEACARGADCAPGFECVGTPGQCRHYCCSEATCQAEPGQFCDIQQTAEVGNTLVPVCMPIQSCKLLTPGYCPDGNTCSVVAVPAGTTSCVGTGNAVAGAACDEEHCGSGLVCLGEVGARQCYSLCHTDNPIECPTADKCRTGGAGFPDPLYGICVASTAPAR